MATSPELTAFLDCISTIRTGIYSTVQHDIATKAFARFLIPNEVHKDVTGSNRWSTNERLNAFMTGLEQSIKSNPSVLEKFVDILRESDAGFYAGLIRTISEPTLPEVLLYAVQHICMAK